MITELTYEEWVKMIGKAKLRPGKTIPAPNGFSPGGAAVELGMSRSGVHSAIYRGKLDAVRVPSPGGGCYFFISPKSLKDFARRRAAA